MHQSKKQGGLPPSTTQNHHTKQELGAQWKRAERVRKVVPREKNSPPSGVGRTYTARGYLLPHFRTRSLSSVQVPGIAKWGLRGGWELGRREDAPWGQNERRATSQAHKPQKVSFIKLFDVRFRSVGRSWFPISTLLVLLQTKLKHTMRRVMRWQQAGGWVRHVSCFVCQAFSRRGGSIGRK